MTCLSIHHLLSASPSRGRPQVGRPNPASPAQPTKSAGPDRQAGRGYPTVVWPSSIMSAGLVRKPETFLFSTKWFASV